MPLCFELQAKVIAVIEMVLSSFFLILFGFIGVWISLKREEILEMENFHNIDHEGYPLLKELLESSPMEQASIFMVPIVYFMSEFALGIFLYRSAEKSQYKRLRIWFTINVTLTAVGAVAYLAEIMRRPELSSTSFLFIINFALTLYSLWVVSSLISEIKCKGVHRPVPFNGCHFK